MALEWQDWLEAARQVAEDREDASENMLDRLDTPSPIELSEWPHHLNSQPIEADAYCDTPDDLRDMEVYDDREPTRVEMDEIEREAVDREARGLTGT